MHHLSASPPELSSIHSLNLLDEQWNHFVPVHSHPKTTTILPKCGSLTETGLRSADSKAQRGRDGGCVSPLLLMRRELEMQPRLLSLPFLSVFTHTFQEIACPGKLPLKTQKKGEKMEHKSRKDISSGFMLSLLSCYDSPSVLLLM